MSSQIKSFVKFEICHLLGQLKYYNSTQMHVSPQLIAEIHMKFGIETKIWI